MLVIRLARTGRTKYPTYRIVAAESARTATGKFVAVLGHYNPHTKELVVQREETVRYLGNGAQPSNSVIKLLQRDGVDLPAWAKLKTKAPKKVEAVVEEAPAAEVTPAELETEAVVEELISQETPETEEVIADEAPAEEVDETPADEVVAASDEVRVGEVAEDAAVADAANAPESIDHTDTAAEADESADKADASEAAAASSATEAE